MRFFDIAQPILVTFDMEPHASAKSIKLVTSTANRYSAIHEFEEALIAGKYQRHGLDAGYQGKIALTDVLRGICEIYSKGAITAKAQIEARKARLNAVTANAAAAVATSQEHRAH